MTEQQLSVGGCVCFWSIGGQGSNVTALKDGLDRMGLGDFAPEPRTPAACLKVALTEHFLPTEKGEKILIRPLEAKDGFAVVSERRGEERNAYEHLAAAKVDEQSNLDMDPWGGIAETRKIQDSIHEAAKWITPGAVGQSLVEIIEELGGVALRPTGGFYWLNEEDFDRWARIAEVFESAARDTVNSPTKVYMMKVVADEQMVRAVGDGLIAEVTGEIERIEEGLFDLKEQALANRQNKAIALQAKVDRYVNAFGMPLDRLKEGLDRVKQAAASAFIMLAADDKTEQGGTLAFAR